MDINWFPGHMVKARREIAENVKLVDLVVMILDARAPFACRNPELEKMVAHKPILFILNKSDLAEPAATQQVVSAFKKAGFEALAMNSTQSTEKKQVLAKIDELYQETAQKLVAKGRRVRPARVMVVGVPNVGKSTFLNQLVGKKIAKTGEKPGVTKGKQWVRINPRVELLDTPGLMWPKINNREQGFLLAVLNIVGENAYEAYRVALYLLEFLRRKRVPELKKRLKTDLPTDILTEELLAELAKARGFLLKGGVPDLEKMAHTLLAEVRQGEWGRLSFAEF